MKLGESDASDPSHIANLFALHFKSAATEPVVDGHHTFHMDNQTHSSIAPFTIPEPEVLAILSNCDANKRGGPDGIPNLFIKNCALSLANPLCTIFNISLSEGVCPRAWKSSSITNIENYRPISKQNVFMKLFDKCIKSRLLNHCLSIIVPCQHGFVPKKSTISNFINFTSFISTELDDSKEVHAIYTDFSKAFNRINPILLIKKLEHYGIRGSLLLWFKDYLSDRVSFVVHNDSVSDPFVPLRGLPQGSILGPLLFLLFINDLPAHILSETLLFADDAKIFRKIHNQDDCLALQNDINRLATWCDANNIALNVDKCASVFFSRKKTPTLFDYSLGDEALRKVDEINDLGVLIDNKLTFRSHITSIVKKAHKHLGFVSRMCKDFNNMACMKTLHFALVRNLLEYGSQIWSPHFACHSSSIESVQRKFSRFLFFKLGFQYEGYAHRLARLNLLGLENRRTLNDSLALFHIVNNAFTTDYSQIVWRHSLHNTRTTTPFLLSITRTQNGRQSNSVIRMMHSFNRSFSDVANRDMPLPPFKKTIITRLKNSQQSQML